MLQSTLAYTLDLLRTETTGGGVTPFLEMFIFILLPRTSGKKERLRKAQTEPREKEEKNSVHDFRTKVVVGLCVCESRQDF